MITSILSSENTTSNHHCCLSLCVRLTNYYYFYLKHHPYDVAEVGTCYLLFVVLIAAHYQLYPHVIEFSHAIGSKLLVIKFG